MKTGFSGIAKRLNERRVRLPGAPALLIAIAKNSVKQPTNTAFEVGKTFERRPPEKISRNVLKFFAHNFREIVSATLCFVYPKKIFGKKMSIPTAAAATAVSNTAAAAASFALPAKG